MENPVYQDTMKLMNKVGFEFFSVCPDPFHTNENIAFDAPSGFAVVKSDNVGQSIVPEVILIDL